MKNGKPSASDNPKRARRIVEKAAPSPSTGISWSHPRTRTLAEGIVDQILKAFLAGDLKPDEFVGTEASLAEQFGVSRMAVRDAIRALVAYGVIETRKGAGGGLRVARGDPDRFIDALAVQMRLLDIAPAQAFDVQFAIETLTAERAATQASKSELARLESILNEAEAELDNNALWLNRIFEFHIALAEASHSPALGLLLQAFIKILTPHYEQRTTVARARGATKNYRKLLNALERNDVTEARKIMQDQLGQVRSGLLHHPPTG